MAEVAKSMDVSKPGKTTPDSTARPVIVGHKPLLKQDPMVSGDEAQAQTEIANKSAAMPLTPHTEKVIAPPTPDKTDEKTNLQPADETTDTEKSVAEKTEAPKADDDEQPVSDDAAIVDAVAEQAGNNRKKPGELTKEEKQRQEAIEKLIEEKKYFIPIKVASRKRQARWNIAILVLVIIIGGYLTVDAGIVGANIKLPVDIIRTSTTPAETAVPAVIPEPPAAPKPTSNNYTSKVDGFQLTYPLTWEKTDRTVDLSPEFLELKPKTPTESDKLVFVELNRGDDPSRTTVPGTTLRQINYTDVPLANGKMLYLREIITSNLADGITVRAGLTDQKGAEKIGQSIAVLDTAFTAADAKTRVKFTSYTATSSNGKPGFTSLEAAQKFVLENKDYADAKSILTSLKFK